MRLEGTRALVTGSDRGIGAGIALRFAEEGADVAVHYHRNEGGARGVCDRIRALGRRCDIFQADASDVAAVQRLVTQAWERLGPLDVLVNNAGIEKRAPFAEVTEADYEQVLRVNLKGPFFATQAYVRALRTARRGGKVINISSVHEDLAFPHFASYCASKGGLRMLTRTLAVELKGQGITINNIAPGAIQTPINQALLEDKPRLEALLQKIPLGRLGQPGDVAGIAVLLASRDGDYVTGATYLVDGGLGVDYEEQ